MPGPFTHIYAARRVADLLGQQGGFVAAGDGPLAAGQPLADPAIAAYFAQVMHTYPKLASLGAIGPDLFFFLGDLRAVPGDDFMLALRMGYLLDTWNSQNWAPLIQLLTSNGYERAHPWSGILALILQIDAAWASFVDAYTPAVAPIVDGFENVANALTGDLLQSLGDYLQEFLNTVEALIAAMGLDSYDFLGLFKLIMEAGEDEATFYWSDMLHYRRTSQMAQALLRRAAQMITQNRAQGEQFLAYALGYSCHLGVDVVGHAFVNEQAGGPYRTHWQRHHLVENHLDAWVYSQTTGPTLAWSLAGNTTGFGNVSGNRFFTGDFTGSGKTEVMFYYPGDGNWWLATFTGTTMSWTLAGNTTGFGDVSTCPFFTGHFTGPGKTDIMFYASASTDGNWWLGTFTGTTLSWTLAGNTRGNGGSPWDFGNTANGRFLTGNFAGAAADGMMFCSPGGNWMVGTFTGTQLQWTLASNTSGFGNVAHNPFFTGNFSGGAQTEVVFYSPGDGNWWLATLRPSVLPQDSFCAAIPGYQSLCQSALYFAVAFDAANPQGDLRRVLPDETPPRGYSSAAQLARKEALDTDGELPDWLAQGIVSAMIETYADTTHPLMLKGGPFQAQMNAALQAAQLPPDPPLPFAVPPGFPLPWEVQTAYKLMLSFFKRSFMDGFDLPMPPPPSGTVPQWPDFGNVTGIDTSSPGSIFASVAADIGAVIGDVLNSIASLIAAITGTVTLELREQIYNNLTLPAWQAARMFRQVLVETGYLIPESFEVDPVGRLKHPNEIDMSLITLGRSVGQPTLPDPGYPWQSVPNEFHRPWAYPNTKLDGSANSSEHPLTRAGPFASGALPDALLRHDRNASNGLRLSFESAASPADTDAITASGAFASASAGGVSPLGDCVRFAAYLIGRLTAAGPPSADFNLDADRGFGYLCWDWNRDPTQAWPGSNNGTFRPPVGWTRTSAGVVLSDPLQLHYLKSRAVTSWVSPAYKHVAYIAADGHVRDLASASGAGAWTATDLTAATGEVPAAWGSLTSWIDKAYEHVVAVGADGHLHEFYRLLGTTAWGHGDITAAAGAPPAGPGALTSWVDSVYQHVVYISADGHIRELWFALGPGPWQSRDVTAATSAPPALPGALTSWVDSAYQHVVYISADGHVHQLYFRLGAGPWLANDLTAMLGAPQAIPGGLTSWVDGRYQHIAFFSADGHVRELRSKLGTGPWTAADVTASASAPPAVSAALTSWVDKTNQHVAYISADGQVQELHSVLGSTSWGNNCLTRLAGATAAVSSASSLTSWVDSLNQHVIYLAGDRHVHELHYALKTGPWLTADLTTGTGSPP
jgi:Zinc dependent phospholipase C